MRGARKHWSAKKRVVMERTVGAKVVVEMVEEANAVLTVAIAAVAVAVVAVVVVVVVVAVVVAFVFVVVAAAVIETSTPVLKM